MASTGGFGDDELTRLAEAPVKVAAVIMAASPSGGIGTAQEIAALVSEMSEAIQKAPPGSLLDRLREPVRRLAQQIQGGEDLSVLVGAPDEMGPAGLEAGRQAVALISEKATPQDATDYKAMLRHVASRVAGAASEGGFLGFGGKQVSAEEQQALAAIDAILRPATSDGGEAARPGAAGGAPGGGETTRPGAAG
jgi:hypothetical protein